VARKAKTVDEDQVIETTVADAPPTSVATVAANGATRTEVQAAVRILHAVVGGMNAAIEASPVSATLAEVWAGWRAGWDTFAAGVERPVWDLDAVAAQVERQIKIVTKWRADLKHEAGGAPLPWLFDEMPLVEPSVTRTCVVNILRAAHELDTPLRQIDNPGIINAWNAWYTALGRYQERLVASWWMAISGDSVRVLGIFADQVEEWRKRLVRAEQAPAVGQAPAARPAVGTPPPSPGWPMWVKVVAGIGIIGGAYAGLRYVISHWASNTPVKPELPMSSASPSPESKE
jgi:hypothetical protein